jgi:hypothetical protein
MFYENMEFWIGGEQPYPSVCLVRVCDISCVILRVSNSVYI